MSVQQASLSSLRPTHHRPAASVAGRTQRTIMRYQLLAAISAAGLLLGASLPAAAANTFNVQVTAPTVATITVSSPGNVTCAPGNTVTGIVACTNPVNATGAIRSSKGGTASLTATAVAP